MKCPRCKSDETSLSWLHERSIVYWCRACHDSFDVERVAVQSTAKPGVTSASPETEGTPES